MRRLSVFNSVTLDGYFTGLNGDMSWARKDPQDAEWNSFVTGNSSSDGPLVFGRVTYEMMVSFWPTPMAIQNIPEVAAGMNARPKIVFSRTLVSADWNNTTLVKGDVTTEIRRMKQEPGGDMVILGSGNIVSQLAQAGLIDEYQIALTPIVLGQGRTMFETVKGKLALKLIKTRSFANGSMVLYYEPLG